MFKQATMRVEVSFGRDHNSLLESALELTAERAVPDLGGCCLGCFDTYRADDYGCSCTIALNLLATSDKVFRYDFYPRFASVHWACPIPACGSYAKDCMMVSNSYANRPLIWAVCQYFLTRRYRLLARV